MSNTLLETQMPDHLTEILEQLSEGITVTKDTGPIDVQSLKDLAIGGLEESRRQLRQAPGARTDLLRTTLPISLAAKQLEDTITPQQAEAFSTGIGMIMQGETTPPHRRRLIRLFRRAGLETMITLGEKTPDYLRLIDEEHGN